MIRLLFGVALMVTTIAGCDRAPTASTANIKPVALHFKVDGMTCDGCAKSIESEVADLPGVIACKASHETGSLTVQTTDPAVESKIIAAVSDLKFTIEPSDDDAAPADASKFVGRNCPTCRRQPLIHLNRGGRFGKRQP